MDQQILIVVAVIVTIWYFFVRKPSEPSKVETFGGSTSPNPSYMESMFAGALFYALRNLYLYKKNIDIDYIKGALPQYWKNPDVLNSITRFDNFLKSIDGVKAQKVVGELLSITPLNLSTTLSKGQEIGPYKYDVFTNSDIPGRDVLRIPQLNETECQVRCSENDDCDFYAYVKPTRDCFLKHADNTNNPNVRFQYKASGVMKPLAPGLEISGFDISASQKTPENCNYSCSSDYRCKMCTHDRGTNTCFLKQYTPNNNVNLGWKTE